MSSEMSWLDILIVNLQQGRNLKPLFELSSTLIIMQQPFLGEKFVINETFN